MPLCMPFCKSIAGVFGRASVWLASLSLAVVAGWLGPQLSEQYDPVTDTYLVELGPLDIPGSLFGRIHMLARISGEFPPQLPTKEVQVRFVHESFRSVTFEADGETLRFPRAMFQEYGIAVDAKRFVQLATARYLQVRFERDDIELLSDDGAFAFTSEQLAHMREFGVRIRLLETEAADSVTPEPAALPEDTAATKTVRIREIQGRGHRSPLVGRDVRGVAGVVTRVGRREFWMQAPTNDRDPATSEGLMVFTGSSPQVAVGDSVVVDGRVKEFYPGGEDTGNLSTTELVEPRIDVRGRNAPLPPAVEVGTRGRKPPGRVITDDAVDGNVERSVFDPEADGIDFWESLEGMRVRVRDAVVVGPTDRYGNVWVLPEAGAAVEARTARGGALLLPNDPNPERLRVAVGKSVKAKVGDRIAVVEGVLDYGHGNFRLLVGPGGSSSRARVRVESGGLVPEHTALVGDDRHLTVATFNVLNLSAVSGERIDRIAKQIAVAMRGPDIVALQEIQDDNGPRNDELVGADRTLGGLASAVERAGGPKYEWQQVDPSDDADGGQPGGNIRVAFLLRPDRVAFAARDATTTGRANPMRFGVDSEAFRGSRKPLVGEFEFAGSTFVLINLHLASKYGSPPTFGRRQPATDAGAAKREAQAALVRAHVDRVVSERPDAQVVVLGDLNEFDFRPTRRLLEGDNGDLVDVVARLPLAERYTYVFEGNSQVLDHVLVPSRLAPFTSTDVVHVNSEFPDAASDHDPIVVRIRVEPSAPRQ